MDKKAFIVYVLVSVSVSTLISGMFGFYFNKNNNRGLPVDLVTSTATGGVKSPQSKPEPVVAKDILSVKGTIAEFKDGKYIITTDGSLKVTVIVDDKTVYATSFSPSEDERKVLYNTSTTTNRAGLSMAPTLKLKVGDRVEVTSKTSIKGKTQFIASMVKLIRL